ncbi:MAG: Gfo/Idh/MocA family oxidoreductase [Spirochaetales bacterium]
MDVLIVGGGMITADVFLPSLYELQRQGRVGELTICARSPVPLRALAGDATLKAAFPGQTFAAYPALNAPDATFEPDASRRCIEALKPRQLVVVAVPDEAHHEVVMMALRADQHVLCVKPLVQTHAHALEIEALARQRGLFVGVEYHKRFDRRSLVARGDYRAGRFGEFAMGEACLIEPWFYRRSNFQNWFQPATADPFTYIGCHYVDLVHFITGLKPVEVSVAAVERKFPNGKPGLMWTGARVRWENGALLNLLNGLGYPDLAAGSNDQGLVMYCEGEGRTGMIRHDDHNRGVSLAYLDGIGPGGSHFNYVSPDFFRLVERDGGGRRPLGYGFESVEALVAAAARVEASSDRQAELRALDASGLLATPSNSAFNELVVEAARGSLTQDGLPWRVEYGASPRVSPVAQRRP